MGVAVAGSQPALFARDFRGSGTARENPAVRGTILALNVTKRSYQTVFRKGRPAGGIDAGGVTVGAGATPFGVTVAVRSVSGG